MRIALRTGGGRGVYELAGRQGNLNASDLFDREIFYELTPSLIIPGRAIASRLQGKPRIRLEDKVRTTHFYRLLAAILLLPKPKREFKTTHGEKLLQFEAYSMTAIKVDVGEINPNKVVLRPTDLLLENADNLQETINFAERMARIARLWEAASQQSNPLAQLVHDLQKAVLTTNPDYKKIEDCGHAILNVLHVDGDPLPTAENQLGVAEPEQQPLSLVQPAQFTHQADFGVEDDTSPLEARFERVKQWRQIAVRGAAGQKFRNNVMATYDFRCVFSGDRLPKTEATDSAGVDAAHILPWSTHNLNAVNNGLCLNKLCHWAFDAGALRLFFDATCSSYVVEIPDKVRSAARKESFDLGCFEKLCRPIPVARLPQNQAFWPSRNYLNELNKVVFRDAT
jgi:putative restriction endonuclease